MFSIKFVWGFESDGGCEHVVDAAECGCMVEHREKRGGVRLECDGGAGDGIEERIEQRDTGDPDRAEYAAMGAEACGIWADLRADSRE